MDVFLNHIGDKVFEYADGDESWGGLLSGAELVVGDKLYRRDLLQVSNAVKMLYSLVGEELVINTSAEVDGNWHEMPGGGTADADRTTDWAAAGSWSWYVRTQAVMGGIYLDTSAPVVEGASYVATVIVNAWGVITEDAWWKVKVWYTDGSNDVACEFQQGPPMHGVHVLRAEFTADRTATVRFETWGEDNMEVYIDECHLIPTRLPADTGWIVDEAAIAEHGRIEEVLLEAEHTEESALAMLQTHLTQHAFADPNVVSLESQGGGTAGLRFYACGLVYTLGWKYTLLVGDSTVTTHLLNLLGESLYVQAGRIATNATSHRLDTTFPVRQWDAIETLLRAGDANGALWKGGIFRGDRFDYEELGEALYVYDGAWRGLDLGLVNPFHLEPARVRFSAIEADQRVDSAIVDQLEVDWDGNVSTSLED